MQEQAAQKPLVSWFTTRIYGIFMMDISTVRWVCRPEKLVGVYTQPLALVLPLPTWDEQLEHV